MSRPHLQPSINKLGRGASVAYSLGTKEFREISDFKEIREISECCYSLTSLIPLTFSLLPLPEPLRDICHGAQQCPRNHRAGEYCHSDTYRPHHHIDARNIDEHWCYQRADGAE